MCGEDEDEATAPSLLLHVVSFWVKFHQVMADSFLVLRCNVSAFCDVCQEFEGDYCDLPQALEDQLMREGFDIESRRRDQGCCEYFPC